MRGWGEQDVEGRGGGRWCRNRMLVRDGYINLIYSE